MKPVRDFLKQLDNFEQEVRVIASYVYAEMVIQHAISQSRRLLSAVNRTPTFWKASLAAFQSAAYIALARVFEQKSPYNIDALLDAIEADLGLFSRQSLASRKAEAGFNDPGRLQAYVAQAHELTHKDVARIRRAVDRRRPFYARAIMPVRHQYLAHRQASGPRVNELYGQGKAKELWKTVCFLHHLHQQLSNAFNNGRKPALRLRSRYSPKVMFNKPLTHTGPHERMVSDVKVLMKLLESTVPPPAVRRRK